MCVCVYTCWCVCMASQRRGLSSRFPQFGLGFVIQGWTVDPGEDREGKKNAKKKNERLMERKLGGCQILLKVFAERLKSEDEDLVGSRIIQSQYPSTIQALLAAAKKQRSLTNHGGFSLCSNCSSCVRHAG